MAVAEEAEVPDAVKSARQHMDQKSPDELPTREGHRLLAVVIPVILPAEADLAVIHVMDTSRLLEMATRWV